MKIYYDSDCKICEFIKNTFLHLEKVGGTFEFLEIRDSKYSQQTKNTIVIEVSDEKIVHRYGQALKTIFAATIFPFWSIALLPVKVLDFIYKIIRDSRKYLKYIFKLIVGVIIFGLCYFLFIFTQKIPSVFPERMLSTDNFLPLTYSSQEYTDAGKNLFLVSHNNQAALTNLERAVELDPTNAQAWFLLGRVNFVLSNLNKSVIDFQKVIELDPKDEQAHYGLGLAYGYQNDLALAAKGFQDYLKIIEDKKSSGEYQNYPPGHWAGYNDLAWIYFLQGNFKEAETVTTEALSKYNNPWLLNMMGAVLLNQDMKEEAQVYFQRAKEYSQNITAEDFGEAYTGDNKEWHEKGFANMKQIIEQNIQKSQK